MPEWSSLTTRYGEAFQGKGIENNPSSENVCLEVKEKSNEPDADVDSTEQNDVDEHLKGAVEEKKIPDGFKKNENIKKTSTTTKNSYETVRVSAQKLDLLLQMIGELSIHQSIIWHARNQFQGFGKMISHSVQLSQKLTKELYDRALSLRMQPIQGLFQRLERNIIELSTELGKEVEVTCVGNDVELDKSVMEKIIDPLTHIVRNAIDHGIEPVSIRLEKGKNEKGKIFLEATQDSNGVVISISDDGGGLVPDKLLKKAKEKQLIADTAKLSDEEIFQIIFLPGFSTAEKVTDVSGRGVGMDVVKSSVEALHGSIHISSELHKGTSFSISLPTSMSIIDAMIFNFCEQRYVVPISEIEEVIDLSEKKFLSQDQMFSLRGQVIPIIRLDYFLSNQRKKSEDSSTLLICEKNGSRIGILVGEVFGEQQIVVRPLNENISGVFGLMGSTILSNGEPGIIIDIPSITESYLKQINRKEAVA